MVTARYVELKAQGEALLREAEEVRRAEAAEVIQEMKKQIGAYSIQPDDLFPEMKSANVRNGRAKKAPKYKGPDGKTWTGGPGRKPAWVLNAVANGEDLEKYAIK